MNKNITSIIIILLLLIIISIWFYSNKQKIDSNSNNNESSNLIENNNSKDNNNIMSKEAILNTIWKNTLLFFSASWCPTCKALKNDLEKNDNLLPDNLEIKELDYDTELELKKKYWVTTQHTLIFIDENENEVLKKIWTTRTEQLVEEYNNLIDNWKLPEDWFVNNIEVEKEFWFERNGLNTNTALKLIDLNLVLDWWPWKDWIPSINNPKFLSINETEWQSWLNDETMWILVKIWWESKFYPYSILYWHEIVNDTLSWSQIAVTFCPLCWTAIAYNRIVEGEELVFWVSWKLYESNLLMYDDKTHSLWSQSLWEAVVWDNLWKILEIIKSDLITYKQFKNNNPEWLVLSTNTGFSRSYSRTPYWSYETDDDLFFPVTNTDKRLHKKELLFVLPYNNNSYAFVRSKLLQIWKIEYNIWNETINIEVINWEINVKIWDKVIPWYIEMFFSWATQHPDNENLWGVE